MSSRHILCEPCGRGHAGIETDYDEGQRYVWGVARMPTPEQRTIRVNGVPQPLPPTFYTCDHCGRSIRPGERACAATYAATKARAESFPAWEAEYLDVNYIEVAFPEGHP